MEVVMIITFLAIGGAVVTAFIWGCCAICRLLARCPEGVHGHLFTAIIWTLITGILTAAIFVSPQPTTPLTYLALLASGSVWVTSWKQFIERCRGEAGKQKRYSLPTRLYVQTFWGPLALWVAVLGIHFIGQCCFEQAVIHKDLPTAFLLKGYGLGDPHNNLLGNNLEDAVRRQDADAVATYLSVGTRGSGYGCAWGGYYSDSDYALGIAVEKGNTMITELLIDYMQSDDKTAGLSSRTLLFPAIEHNQPKQVQTLLRHGIDRNACNDQGKRPIEIAKKLGNKEIIALLSQQEQ